MENQSPIVKIEADEKVSENCESAKVSVKKENVDVGGAKQQQQQPLEWAKALPAIPPPVEGASQAGKVSCPGYPGKRLLTNRMSMPGKYLPMLPSLKRRRVTSHLEERLEEMREREQKKLQSSVARQRRMNDKTEKENQTVRNQLLSWDERYPNVRKTGESGQDIFEEEEEEEAEEESEEEDEEQSEEEEDEEETDKEITDENEGGEEEEENDDVKDEYYIVAPKREREDDE